MAGREGVTIAAEPAPCTGCGEPTKVRIFGKAGHAKCIPEEAAAGGAVKFRFLDDLTGAYAPKRRTEGRLRTPWWQPPMPEITDLVQTSGWSWSLPPIPSTGHLAVLDRTAAFLSSLSSVQVAHGALVHTPDETTYRGLPGFYKVTAHPWQEYGTPHPLGACAREVETGTAVWVPHPRAQLLQQLADQGRYPDGFIVDAYTCGREKETGKAREVRLDKWAGHLQTVRRAIIERHGRYDESRENGMTLEYEAFKIGFSQAITLMKGTKLAGQPRAWKPNVLQRRPDWGWAVEDLSACTLWRWCDDSRQVMTDLGRPELSPVAMRNVDELVVPLQALELLTTTPRSGGRRPLTVSPAGIALGTFKVKVIT